MTDSRLHSLIIGGTRGIGRAVTRAFAAAGHTVSVIGRRAPNDADRDQPSVRYWTADLVDKEARNRALQEVMESAGKLNHLVFLQRFRGQGDPWVGEMETTLTATKEVVEALQDKFADSGERAIVMVSTVIGDQVVENQPVGYHVAKVGLKAMVRYYAVKFGPLGIRVNGVAPCTTLKEESKDFYLGNADLVKMFQTMTPLGRMGTSEDVASVVSFLASSQAGFVTGQVLTVDGGTSLVWPEALARKLTGLK
jgi:NAD(P)-dependent dehydrogenase (short-subunit alcohol dehydrogenase family)